MAEFFRTSTIWVIDFRFDGHPRRWFKAFRQGEDASERITGTLRDLYGSRARLVELRPATEVEELAYLRDDLPRNAFCPTGR